MQRQNRRFAFVIDGDIAFIMEPTQSMPNSDRLEAALATNPEIIEIPPDHPNLYDINADWLYLNGEFVNKATYNPNVPPPPTA